MTYLFPIVIFHNNTDIEFFHIFGIHLYESIQYY